MTGELLRHIDRVLTKDAYVKPESVEVLVDRASENAKVTRPSAPPKLLIASWREQGNSWGLFDSCELRCQAAIQAWN